MSDAANIRLGAPSSITLAGTSVGYVAKDGVELVRSADHHPVYSGAVMGKTKNFRTRAEWQAKFKMQESTLENWLLACDWNDTIDTGPPRTLDAIEQTAMTERTLVFVGRGPDNKTWTITATRAVLADNSGLVFSDEDHTEIEVTLDLMCDSNGKAFTMSEATTDSTAPTVASVTPVDGASDQAITVDIEIEFSESMKSTTVLDSSNIMLIDTDGDAAVAATLSYDDGTYTVTLNPDASLSNSTTYTVIVTTAVEDAAGNNLAATFVSDFTTIAA